MVEGKPYISYGEFTGFLEDKPELLENQKVLVLLVYSNEMKIREDFPDLLADPAKTYGKVAGGCSWSDTNYAMGYGLNADGAWASYSYHMKHTNGPKLGGCSALGNAVLNCVGFMCYVSQAWCCPGQGDVL